MTLELGDGVEVGCEPYGSHQSGKRGIEGGIEQRQVRRFEYRFCEGVIDRAREGELVQSFRICDQKRCGGSAGT